MVPTNDAAEVLLTDDHVFVHLNHDAINILIHHFLELWQNTFGLNGNVPASQLMLTVSMSGSIHGSINTTLDHFDTDDCYVIKTFVFSNFKEGVFADDTSGWSKVKCFRFIFAERDHKSFRFCQDFLFFHAARQKNENGLGAFAIDEYLEITQPFKNIDMVLNCICLRGASDNEVDRKPGAYQYSEEHIEVGWWYRVVPFLSIRSVHQILTSNYAVALFTSRVPWSEHLFYFKTFYRAWR